MLNKYLTEQTWSQGVSATNSSNEEIHWSSENATKRDITSWIYYLFYGEQRMEAINKLRSVINTDPVLMGVHVENNGYDISENRDTPLWRWNDAANWEQISRLMALVTL